MQLPRRLGPVPLSSPVQEIMQRRTQLELLVLRPAPFNHPGFLTKRDDLPGRRFTAS